MTPGFVAVPFSLPGVYGGFGEGDGLAQVNEAGLTLQFEVRDSFIGALKSGVKEVPIPLSEVSSVDLKSGPFGGYLTIATKSLTVSNLVPGSEPGYIRLRIPRAGRQAARKAETLLNTRLAELELDEFRRELDERRGGT